MRMILAVIIEIILFVSVLLFAKICMPNGAPYIFYVLEKRCALTNDIFVCITFLLAVLGTAMLFATSTQEAMKLKEYEKKNKELEIKLEDKNNEVNALLSKVGTLETAIQKAINR